MVFLSLSQNILLHNAKSIKWSSLGNGGFYFFLYTYSPQTQFSTMSMDIDIEIGVDIVVGLKSR